MGSRQILETKCCINTFKTVRPEERVLYLNHQALKVNARLEGFFTLNQVGDPSRPDISPQILKGVVPEFRKTYPSLYRG
jgi:hypothetical protein